MRLNFQRNPCDDVLPYIHQTSSLQTSFSNIAHAMMSLDYIFLYISLKQKMCTMIVVLYIVYNV